MDNKLIKLIMNDKAWCYYDPKTEEVYGPSLKRLKGAKHPKAKTLMYRLQRNGYVLTVTDHKIKQQYLLWRLAELENGNKR